MAACAYEIKGKKYPQECLRMSDVKGDVQGKKRIGKSYGRNGLANVAKGSEIMMQS